MIDITRSELNFIREAVQEKHDRLMKVLDFAQPLPAFDPFAAAPIKAEGEPVEWTVKAGKGGKVIASRQSTKAPWGYKKDGTPKKRPGRKV